MFEAVKVANGSAGNTGAAGVAPNDQVAVNFGRGFKRVLAVADYNVLVNAGLIGTPTALSGTDYVRLMTWCEDTGLGGVPGAVQQVIAQNSSIVTAWLTPIKAKTDTLP